MAFVHAWEENRPDGSTENFATADDYLKGKQAAVRERLAVDHNFKETEGADTTIGQHVKATLIEQSSAPSAPTNAVIIYSKEVSGKSELFVIDEDGNEIQITSGGAINIPAESEQTYCGDIKFSNQTADHGKWLLCSVGRTVSRTTYADLFALIGTQFGAGDGTTTFGLPSPGKFPISKDSSQTEFDTIGETGGEKTHTLTTDEIPSHTHPLSSQGSSAGASYLDVSGAGSSGPSATGATGGGGAHNTIPPYQVIGNMFIRS